jgi:hypothetical protein
METPPGVGKLHLLEIPDENTMLTMRIIEKWDSAMVRVSRSLCVAAGPLGRRTSDILQTVTKTHLLTCDVSD